MEIFELTVGPKFQTNCYIVKSELGHGVCIDPGDEPEKIAAKAKAEGVNIRYILLTHGHYDHIGGVTELKRMFPEAKSCVMAEDLDICKNPALVDNSTVAPIDPDMLMSDGDIVKVDELSFKYMATPGHTKGSAIILCGDKMFSGDTVFSRGCGRTDYYGGSTGEMRSSLKKIGNLEGDYEIFTGHGPGTSLEIERYANMFMRKAMGLSVL